MWDGQGPSSFVCSLLQSTLVFGKPDGDRLSSPRGGCLVVPSPRHAGAASYVELEARGQALEANTSIAEDLGLVGTVFEELHDPQLRSPK